MSLGTLGKYELLEKIAEGGMGELFRARQIGPAGVERIVALKRIRASMIEDARLRQMFIEEARIASFVLHPNLVTLFQFEEEGELLYLVMELVEGRDLAKILSRSRQMRDPLRIQLAVRIAEQVAQGLDYLHRLGRNGQPLQLVHRDVSPQNVLISFDGAVKLTDFGIAYMHRSEPVTQAGILKGKMGYLTPEQLTEVPVDGRADVFCLGIVLWEMLTGARLFQGTSDASILQQVMHKRIPLPSTLNVDVPPALDRVVMRALERDRSRRFERAGDMALALGALQGWMATDLELAQELRRYFPEWPGQAGQPSSPTPVDAPTDSVPTAIDRPERQEIVVTTDAVLTTTVPEVVEPAPRGPPPPPPPPQTAPSMARLAARRRSARTARSVVLLASGLLLTVVLGLWSRGRNAPIAPRQVVLASADREHDGPPAAGSQAPSGSEVQTAAAAEVPAMPTGASPVAANPDEGSTARAETTPLPPTPRPHRSTLTHASTVIRASNVSPWAEVILDGSSLGYTARTWKVVSGHHHLLLRNDEEGIEREFDLEFPPGGEIHLRGKLRSLQPELIR